MAKGLRTLESQQGCTCQVEITAQRRNFSEAPVLDSTQRGEIGGNVRADMISRECCASKCRKFAHAEQLPKGERRGESIWLILIASLIGDLC
jgi:hypothetical protein